MSEPKTRAVGRFEWEDALANDSRVKPAARAVLLTLARHADVRTGEGIYPSLNKTADGIGMSRRHLTDQLRTALDLGWLEKTGQRQSGVSVYRLTVPTSVAVEGSGETAIGVAAERYGGSARALSPHGSGVPIKGSDRSSQRTPQRSNQGSGTEPEPAAKVKLIQWNGDQVCDAPDSLTCICRLPGVCAERRRLIAFDRQQAAGL